MQSVVIGRLGSAAVSANSITGVVQQLATIFIFGVAHASAVIIGKAIGEGDQPRVRPFGTIDLYNGQLTIQTGRKKDVAKQMLANPKVEICAFDGSHWLRVAAKAVEVPEIAAQEHMLDAYPDLRAAYTPGDGNTTVFALTEATATFSSFTEPSRTVTF